ncbi:FKBP-type peptidyl-prolyl cis-trans isomerase [Altererythrobacter sp. SALINAS58]|uniref:FKBP-type peptidyl-prolyl cis-trans isomerase n=1 Tax=Alteripontixanthobacter muriae TaxID=2705546 RepID=UPI001576EAE6|nr:FKBP-type peptidyl-prolyl cis-trans isomerase [Alteripontixanthobacter muriae]NTZ42269.1 FKBP-type peptidyl-prolyl cis-trans isomerase [Alteripontixanthobacter muriae]
MTEVTRVPIQPVDRGTLPKMWIAVALAVLLAAGVAWATVPEGVEVTTITPGTGPSPSEDDVVLVNYVGKLPTGEVFDQAEATPLPLEGMIPGFTEGAQKMQKGGSYLIEIPAELGYGAEEKVDPATGEVRIPANSTLLFEVELIDFISRTDFEQRMRAMEQMMQMQGQMPGAPVGAPPVVTVPQN